MIKMRSANEGMCDGGTCSIKQLQSSCLVYKCKYITVNITT